MTKDLAKKDKEFILPFWNAIFGLLEKISIFSLLRRFENCRTHYFVELWTFGNLIAALIMSYLIYEFKYKALAYLILFYGLERVFEVLIYQINVLLFHPYRAAIAGKPYYIKSAIRMIVLLLHNYIEIIFWFAGLYISIIVLGNQQVVESWGTYLKLSSFCFVSSDLTVLELTGILDSLRWIAYVEVVSGLIMTVISLSRFIGTLPNVTKE